MASKHLPWHSCEINISWRMYLRGHELTEIAAQLKRSVASIEYCLATHPNPFLPDSSNRRAMLQRTRFTIS